MNDFIQILRTLGPARLVLMGGVVAGVLGFFVFLTVQITSPSLSLLYADLENTDSNLITARLQSDGVLFELENNGSTIMVPKKDVGRLRLMMAEQGLPAGGSIGYEIFDESESLGTTSFVQNIQQLRALEGELARTIRTIEMVDTARVHLVLQRRELFAREKLEPSASIVLKLRTLSLDASQVRGIQHLVAAAVPGLKASRITILDTAGQLMSAARSAEPEDRSTTLTDRTTSYETRLRHAIEDLISKVVGFGNVRAKVSAELDFDTVTTSTETYDPDTTVIRSSQTVDEQTEARDQEQRVSVAANLPQAVGQGGGNSTSSTRSEETLNYEISKVTETQIHDATTVKRLSVGVLINGRYTGSSGDRQYIPRTDEELAQLTALVQSAIGYQENRGDVVRVVHLAFPDPGAEAEEELPAFLGLGKGDYFRIAEIGVISVVALLVLLLVVRPLVGRMLAAMPEAASTVAGAVGQIADATKTGVAVISAAQAPSDGEKGLLAAQRAAETAETEFEQMLNLANIEGRVKASSMRKVGELVQNNPEEAVSIIRTWLTVRK